LRHSGEEGSWLVGDGNTGIWVSGYVRVVELDGRFWRKVYVGTEVS
jgi:hypothetical protein